MRKNKLLAAVTGLALCACIAPLCFGSAVRASAADAERLPDVSDDFEAYTADGYIETDDLFKQNWTNNVLKGGEEQGMDAHLKGIAKVEYENGDAGNRVLHLNNAAVGQDSFFHIGPAGDYRAKNFTVGFRFKYLTESVKERSWIGVSFRKKAEAHYTGTNNLMFTVQRYKESAAVGGNAYAIINGGNANDLGAPGTAMLFGDVLTLESEIYTIPNAAENADTPWIDYKLEVQGTNYKLSVDDTVIVDCTFEVPSYDYFGYLSLNCCTANVLVDDFYVINQDTALPPVINPLPAPVLTWNEETRTVNWEKIDGANLYSVFVNDELVKTGNKNFYRFEEIPAAGEYRVRVKAISVDTFEALDSALSEPVVYTVGGGKAKGGCGGSVSGAVILAPLAVVAGFLIKRRK